MKNEMVERVARALAPYVLEQIMGEAARAAIVVMREPTEAMIHVGGRVVAGLSTGRAIEPYELDFKDAWQAAFDTELG